MKKQILKVATVIMMILSLTCADFMLLGASIVSYAVDAITEEKATNHKNVEFMACIKNGNILETSKNVNLNDDNLNLYFKIAVKQEGYFNGKIELTDSNFALKQNSNLSEKIQKIENNTIYLNQINAGEEIEFEVGIEMLVDSNYNLDLLNKESKIVISGNYVDSTQKDITINAQRTVNVNIVNPYNSKNIEENLELSQEIITNKIFSYNGENKRIIQIEVTADLKDKLYPVENAIFEIKVPQISDKMPTEVFVNANENNSINGRELSKENWDYNKENGIVTVTINNEKKNNKVVWLREGNDKFIITYVFDEDVVINNEVSKVSQKISFYDENSTTVELDNTLQIVNNEKNNIVKSTISQKEPEIYKGSIYAGIERDIVYTNNIDVNLNNVANVMNVTENQENIGATKLNATYKRTIINKENLINVLGSNGTLYIKNAETNAIIYVVNSSTEADQNGNIVVEYPANILSVVFSVEQPQNIGRISIENIKTIKEVNKNIVKDAIEITTEVETEYVIAGEKTELEITTSKIDLKETETEASLQINRTELSAMKVNENVEFRVVLNSNNEKNELYKNPTVKVQLPEEIEKIDVKSIKLLYEDEMQIKSAKLVDRTIEVELQGEQTQYKGQAIEGAIILINVDLTTNKKIATSTAQINMTYTNANVVNYKNSSNIGTDSKTIEIVSYAGLVTTNEIDEYGISVINNEGTKSALLRASSAKDITIQKNIINNNEGTITDVRILGTYPVKSAFEQNNIDITVGEINVANIDSQRVSVYYTNNSEATDDLQNAENGWSQNLDVVQVKKYLVVVDKLAVLEEVVVSYNATIPAELEYNESAEEGYTVTYKEANTAVLRNVRTDNIVLTTGVGANLNTTLKAYVGGEEATSVRSQGFITYVAEITNIGSEDVENVSVTGQIPEGTVYIENEEVEDGATNVDTIVENNDKEEVKFNIEKIAQGETITKRYQVRVKESAVGTNLVNSIVTKYGEATKISNEVSLTVQGSDIKVILTTSNDSENLYSKAGYRYFISVTNLSNSELNNVQVQLKLPEYIIINSVVANDMEVDEGIITIPTLLPDETKVILMYVYPIIDVSMKDSKVSLVAIASKGEEKYYSNDILRNLAIKEKNLELEDEDDAENNQINDGVNNGQGQNDVNGEQQNTGNEQQNENAENGSSNNSNSGNNKNESVTRIISGIAWLDENENGKKDSNEKLMSGIIVSLLNVETNEMLKDAKGNIITTTTNNDGYYSINSIPKGQYLVLFDYDKTNYWLTDYKRDGISESENSNVILKTINVAGTEKTLGCTEIIKVEDNNISNVNIGLKDAKIYDLKLDKYVSKVVVQDSKNTKAYEYKNETLAKVELDSKLINNTMVVVEYTIKVTNEGEVNAYAKKIVDYLSNEYQFNSNLNKDWYKSGNNLYNSSLANEAIKPGESKEIKLVVTKAMTENSTGLISNVAEIAESYNEYGLKDVDSTESNKMAKEDDMGTADLIIGIKTGQILLTIGLILTTIVVLVVGTYLILKIFKMRLI